MATHPSIRDEPSWPSLYNPHSELSHIQHQDPIQPGATYLTDAEDVFRFTLYWTLVLYLPLFALLGLYAAFNLAFPPSRKRARGMDPFGDDAGNEDQEHAYPLNTLPPPTNRRNSNHFLSVNVGNGYQSLRSDLAPSFSSQSEPPLSPSRLHPQRVPKRINAGRTRLIVAFLVFLVFFSTFLIGAVLSSAIVGFVVFGLYKAGHFYMSSWIPFLWAAIQVFTGVLSVWPFVINII
ncbi:hypothetical protein D9758_015795 [Tetrapyrgos nigripes]|uniref:Uncharacterized protein n=1 Tax=Tetrapyrgos nigripes TaxID=182062 RepID=A0A8H5FC26_9AGAR|nr:hypothetical protein D9758_015795 [Tetrapyrgos nigripes]